MKKLIGSDMKKVLRSLNFWIAVGAVIVCSVLNLIQALQLDGSKCFGGLGLFIYSQYSNHLINTLVPFIPAFVFMPLMAEDTRTAGFMIAREISTKKYLAARSLTSAIAGGSVFIVAFLMLLIGFFLFDPTVQAINYEPTGLFSDVYFSSPLLYAGLFIVYSALFGAVYGFFGFAIGLSSRSVSMAVVLPGLVYHYASLIWYYFEGTPLSFISLLLPNLTYVFAGIQSPTLYFDKAIQLGVIVLIGVTLLITGYWKLQKEHINNQTNEKRKCDPTDRKPPVQI